MHRLFRPVTQISINRSLAIRVAAYENAPQLNSERHPLSVLTDLSQTKTSRPLIAVGIDEITVRRITPHPFTTAHLIRFLYAITWRMSNGSVAKVTNVETEDVPTMAIYMESDISARWWRMRRHLIKHTITEDLLLSKMRFLLSPKITPPTMNHFWGRNVADFATESVT